MFKKYFLLTGILVSYTFINVMTQDQQPPQNPIRAVVLAAGRSTRFKTQKSKLLFPICGRAMVLHPLKTLDDLNIPISLVLGYQADEVKAAVTNAGIKNVMYALQEKQLGTGHAVACAQNTWANAENIIILYGDMPLVTREIIAKLFNAHSAKNATLTFTTCTLQDPQRYGRIINTNGKYENVEAKDCTQEQLKITTINAGIYVINQQWLTENINKITPSKVSGEFYLPDLIKMASDQGKVVQAIPVPFVTIQGANTLQELEEVEHLKNLELIHNLMSNGVRFEAPYSTLVEVDVTVAPDSVIRAGVQLRGKTTIGKGTTIDAYSIIQDATIGDNCTIQPFSFIERCTVNNNTKLPPATLLHP